MVEGKRFWRSLLVAVGLISVLLLYGCGDVSTDRAEIAVQSVPVPKPQGDTFRERQQIFLRDAMSNRADFVLFAYRLNDAGNPVIQWTCQGLPVSSTESGEPDNVYTVTGSTGNNYGLYLGDDSGTKLYSNEAMGLDGTYGDPVPFLYCITPAGHLKQWNANADVDISSVPNVYGNTGQMVDEQQLAKKLIAEQTLRDGGCIDDNLNPINCDEVEMNINGFIAPVQPATVPTATPEGE
jgi:hypothetical protein